MITQINPRNQQFKICEINAAQRRGQAIVEYLTLAVAVIAAAYLMVDAVRDKATQVAERELDRVDELRTH